MNKNEFLNELRAILWRLPEDERESALTYYEEFIEEAGPENEQEVISKLGTPQRVADNIFREFNTNIAVAGTPNYSNTNDVRQENEQKNTQGSNNQYNNTQGQGYNNQYNNNQNQGYNYQYNNSQKQQKNTNTILIIILLVVCSPIILGLGGTLVGILVAIAATIFGLGVAAIATVVSLIIAGIVVIIAGISSLFVSTWGGVLLIGTGLVVLGIGLLLAVPTMALLAKGIPAIVRGLISFFKNIFARAKTRTI
jgi:uncharacterized membrane protein